MDMVSGPKVVTKEERRARTPPALRFMLSDEAKREAQAMHRYLTQEVVWGNLRGDRRAAFVEKYVVAAMETRWPHVARADRAVGGLVTAAFRAFAAMPDVPFFWADPVRVLAAGTPEILRQACERVIGHRDGPASCLEEEASLDRFALAASGHFRDRDAPEADGVLDEVSDCPF